jgi:rare lipoprotein A (peptidoglycan hydrolase)
MIALIPGLAAAMAYLQPQPSAPPAPQEEFSHLLAAAAPSGQRSGPPEAPPPSRYVVQPGDNLTCIAKKLGYDDPLVLAQANKLKDPNLLQVGQVLTLPENTPTSPNPGLTRLAKPPVKTPVARAAAATAVNSSPGRKLVVASWYGTQHHGKLMANGEPFNMYADTVAHKKLPLGTPLTLTNPRNGASVKVQVTDRGPYISGRNLDLSYGAARKLGVVKAGVAKLWMEES